jgi:hypothetical protein
VGKGGYEHLGSEVLGIGAVADFGVHEPVDAADVVEIDGVPVGIGILAYHSQSRLLRQSRTVGGVGRSAILRVIIHHRLGLPGCNAHPEIGAPVTRGRATARVPVSEGLDAQVPAQW